MLFMVIERFRDNDSAADYRRFLGKGRMLPDGFKYVDSWVKVNGRTNIRNCLQTSDFLPAYPSCS